MPPLFVVDIVLEGFGNTKSHLFNDIEHAAKMMGAGLVTDLVLPRVASGRGLPCLDRDANVIQHFLAQRLKS